MIEELDKLDLKSNFYDIVVSNCVVNLSNNKQAVFEQVYQLLKKGGEFYFSDIYSDCTIPEKLRNDKVLWESVYLVHFIGMILYIWQKNVDLQILGWFQVIV